MIWASSVLALRAPHSLNVLRFVYEKKCRFVCPAPSVILSGRAGLFAGKQTKNAYKQRAANAHRIANDAYAKARNGGMPSFIKASAFGRAQWNAAEQARRAKEAALRERIHKVRPSNLGVLAPSPR
jgi:hypothetical protein